MDVALDSSNNLYIVDSNNNVIRKVNALTGNITVVAGTPRSGGYGGDGSDARTAYLNYPTSIALDS